MPLLMCPNDDSSMQTIERSGVQFDMCPTCRGVWLDRGELEKLMSAAQAPATATPHTPYPAPQPATAPVQSPPWGGRQPDYRSDYRPDHKSGHRPDHRRDDDYRKRKKRDSIFDIFDFD